MRPIVGIDENGLGPRLGPLVVTAITAHADDRGDLLASKAPGRAFRARLGDSKGLVSFGDSFLGEAWARAIAEGTGEGATAQNPDELFAAFSLEKKFTLQAECPSDHLLQCWGCRTEAFEASAQLVRAVRRDLARMAERGLHVVRVRVAIVCTKRLNAAVDQGLSRFAVDLHTMERLLLDAREAAGSDIIAVCGKVGGYDRYSNQFGPLAGRLHSVVCEGRPRSEYQIPGVGRIAFVRDADAHHLLVCMASLIGKWVRDLLMMRIVRYHRENDANLPNASGYHDPITTRFISETAILRKERNVPDVCFERTRIEPLLPRGRRGNGVEPRLETRDLLVL